MAGDAVNQGVRRGGRRRVGVVAIPATIFFGWLGGRWSQRGAIYVALALWLGVLAMMATLHGREGAIVVTVALGLVFASTQSLFRSLFATLTPVGRTSEYFGFNTLAGRASAALGPLAFGLVSAATGSPRIAMASLAIFFVAGGAILSRVRIPAPSAIDATAAGTAAVGGPRSAPAVDN